ncbi:MAG: calcium-binding protein, partial [Selenomonadaceae bacterium]|nr:calcium-binding protein [Selenomonadaceae bacterium]
MAKTQQQVIKDFMSALVNNETLDLDEAVYVACSEVPESKKFKTMNDATKRFIDDCNNFMEPYKDYAASHYHKDTDYNNYLNKKAKEFLITYCGIDLDNEDTGAITGKDAGGSTIEKTAESIVPETDSSDEPNFVDVIINTSTGEHEPIQSLNFTRNGLEILVYDSLSSDEKKVVRGLYKWWIEEGLNLIKESYDISFNEERSFNEESVSFHKLRIIFYDNESSSVLASTGGNGEPWSLSRLDHAFIGYRDLNINIAHYKNLISSNENGTNGSVGKYLDRTIAHELTHAVMSANINDYDDLPEFIVEGMAELTHGVDDVRGDNILKLALGAVDSLGDMRLEKALNPNNIAVDSNDYYAGGYMFLRYFAKQISEVLLDTSEPEPEPETSSSAVEVMHNFLDSLNNTYLRGNAAVNEAIQSSSNFTDLEDLINKFIADFNQSSSGDDFLKTYCGINLDNEDTGAITGKDAGGSVVKTKESVVPELGSTTSSYPDSNSIYYRGLTINFPSRYSLNETQQNIIAGINTWWLKSALDLAEETYGLSFNDSGVTFNTLDISFDVSEAPERDSYFMFWSNDWTGKVSRMTLHINSDHYTSLTTTDTNGTNTSSVSNKYLDEVIASLINNALIAANVNYSWKLPSFVDYGLDFLMTGADNGTKTRTAIIDLASDADKLIEFTLNNNRTAVGLRDTDTYDSAAGYMLMRYLAKNAHRTYDSTVSKGTKEADIINIMNDDYVIRTYSGDDVIYSWDSASIIYAGEGNDTIKNYNSDYYDTGKTSDNKNSILHGGAGNDYILNANRDSTINGGTGNDVIELADESTNAVIRYASGDGNDTIYGFTAADMLQIISSDYIIETRDENVIISVPSDDDSGTITVVDGAYTDLNIVTVKGDTIFDDDTIPEDDTTSDGNDDYTINKAMTAVTLGSGFKGTFDLADLAKVKTVVGSQVSNDVEIIGNDKVNKLIGGSG